MMEIFLIFFVFHGLTCKATPQKSFCGRMSRFYFSHSPLILPTADHVYAAGCCRLLTSPSDGTLMLQKLRSFAQGVFVELESVTLHIPSLVVSLGAHPYGSIVDQVDLSLGSADINFDIMQLLTSDEHPFAPTVRPLQQGRAFGSVH